MTVDWVRNNRMRRLGLPHDRAESHEQIHPSWALEKWARIRRAAMSQGFQRNSQLWYSAGMQLEDYAHVLSLVRCPPVLNCAVHCTLACDLFSSRIP